MSIRVLPHTPNPALNSSIRAPDTSSSVRSPELYEGKCIILICSAAQCQHANKAPVSSPPPHNSAIVQAGPQGPKPRLFRGHAGIGLETRLACSHMYGGPEVPNRE